MVTEYNLGAAMSRVLQFTQPKALRHAFVITENNVEVGSLEYEGLAHRKATAQLEGSAVRFVRKGFITTKIEVLQTESQQPIAEYSKPLFKGGSITLANKTYHFGSKGGILKSHYAWMDEQDNIVIAYEYGGFIKSGGDITIMTNVPTAATIILVPLGLFIALNTDEDDSAGASSGAIS